MKTTSTSISEKIFHFVFTFLTSAGLGYSLVNSFILNKPDKDLLLVMICLFFASMALWQRKKWNKQ
ncbi:hypothetical protein ACHRVK_01400 [Flavobacterium plurextorum]|uniref:PEP-CTERM protein-sorting domain-containing protein n=1 Tax=Flavobacterium plurextorum TaxID=1114867 RepID=A0ABX4CX57_9FLAO|nr:MULTISPECIES: hypothetical protein [Flavobacterium]OXB09678.1 hypothetical protein B0A81_05995 [Flavobacterium plurextorum]UUW09940.1 hypothetical protein NLG42_03855 [Flavobacterium plurextorum]